MKYLVDYRYMTGNFRGMGRYAHQLIAPITSDVLALLPDGEYHDVDIKSYSSGKGFFPFWEQYVLPRMVSKTGGSVLICPYNTAPIFGNKNNKLVLVVHDLIFMRPLKDLPLSVSFYQTLGRIYRRFIVPRAIARADHIITVSSFTKEEIENRYGFSKPIHVIPNSISYDWLEQTITPVVEREKFFLTVAGESPSKNLNKLIKAFSIYVKKSSSEHILKVVGVKPDFHHKFNRLSAFYGVSNNVEFIDYVTTDELRVLYSKAKGFVFASTFEGFGIPLIEAMASGVPIICSNTTSLPEVVGDCAYTFSPFSEYEISDAFHYFDECNSVTIERNVRRGLARVKLYDERNVYKKFCSFWDSLNE